MTREDVIQELQNCIDLIKQDGQDYLDERDVPLLNMAIEALSQPIVAKHFDIQSGHIYCSPEIAENVKVVVRCKDCIHYEKHDTWSACTYWSGDPYEQASVIDDDFCSYGERREP